MKRYEYSNFINRELSWLEFNTRVLDESRVEENPILERLKFISIASSNLDEFFMVRVAGLMLQIEAGIEKVDIAGMKPLEQLTKIRSSAREQIKDIYSNYKRLIEEINLSPNLRIKTYRKLNQNQISYVENYYNEVVLPIITPMAIDIARPFPHIKGKNLHILVILEGERYCVIRIPDIIKRLIEVPSRSKSVYILIGNQVEDIVKGYEIKEVVYFRVTRDGDMIIDEERARDLLEELENRLRERKWRQVVRVECSRGISREAREFLRRELDMSLDNFYEIDGPIDTTFIEELLDKKELEDLRYKKIEDRETLLLKKEDIFATIGKNQYLYIIHMKHLKV